MIFKVIFQVLKSYGKGIVKHVLSAKPSFANLAKKGKQIAENSKSITNAIGNDSKKLIKEKLNFGSKISEKIRNSRDKLFSEALGIDAKSIFEKRRAINQLKKTGATLQEILEFEREYGLDPKKAKSEYNSIHKKDIKRDTISLPDINESELVELDADGPVGVLADYMFKLTKSADKNSTIHSIETLKSIAELDENLLSDNNDILNNLFDAVDESNLMNANNVTDVKKEVIKAAKLSSDISEKIAEMSQEQSENILQGIDNIAAIVKDYHNVAGQKMDMLASLSEIAKEEPEEDNSHSFMDLIKTQSLIVDMLSESKKNPMDIVRDFEMAMNEVARDVGQQVGFAVTLFKDALDTIIKSHPFAGKILQPISDIFAEMVGLPKSGEGEKKEENNGNLIGAKNVSVYGGGENKYNISQTVETDIADKITAENSKTVEKTTEKTVEKEKPEVHLIESNAVKNVVQKKEDRRPSMPNKTGGAI